MSIKCSVVNCPNNARIESYCGVHYHTYKTHITNELTNDRCKIKQKMYNNIEDIITLCLPWNKPEAHKLIIGRYIETLLSTLTPTQMSYNPQSVDKLKHLDDSELCVNKYLEYFVDIFINHVDQVDDYINKLIDNLSAWTTLIIEDKIISFVQGMSINTLRLYHNNPKGLNECVKRLFHTVHERDINDKYLCALTTFLWSMKKDREFNQLLIETDDLYLSEYNDIIVNQLETLA